MSSPAQHPADVDLGRPTTTAQETPSGVRPPGEAQRNAISPDEFRQLFDSVCNWSRWGEADELGTLNLIQPARLQETVWREQTPRRSIGLSRPISPTYSPENRTPMLHHMISSGAEAGHGEHGMSDWFGLAPHGFGMTHVDALSHMSWDGELYNGAPASTISTSRGGNHGSVDRLKNGVLGRGVLLDLPASLGSSWFDPGFQITPGDLDTCVERQGLDVLEGDILLIRTGRDAREAAHGPANYWVDGLAGLHPTCAPWMHSHGIALLGTDGGGDAIPSVSEGVGFPLHILCLVSMGMWMIDSMYLEDLATACQERQDWSFAFALSAIRLKNATGAPVNPLALV